MPVGEPDARVDATRVAIEALTLWMEKGPEARLNAAKHIADLALDNGPSGSTQLVSGLLNLSMFLVYLAAKEQSATGDDIEERARMILQTLSPRLPDF